MILNIYWTNFYPSIEEDLFNKEYTAKHGGETFWFSITNVNYA